MDLQCRWNALGCTNGQTLNVRLSGKSVRESESTKDAQHRTIHSVAGETSIRCMHVDRHLSKGS